MAGDARPRARVMIASAGALSAPEVAWSLVDAGFEVFGATAPGRRPALRRAEGVTLVSVEDPRRDADRALEELIVALRGHGCEVFLPLDDYTLLLCGELARAAPEVRLPVDPAQLPLALDKSVHTPSAISSAKKSSSQSRDMFAAPYSVPVMFTHTWNEYGARPDAIPGITSTCSDSEAAGNASNRIARIPQAVCIVGSFGVRPRL